MFASAVIIILTPFLLFCFSSNCNFTWHLIYLFETGIKSGFVVTVKLNIIKFRAKLYKNNAVVVNLVAVVNMCKVQLNPKTRKTFQQYLRGMENWTTNECGGVGQRFILNRKGHTEQSLSVGYFVVRPVWQIHVSLYFHSHRLIFF